MLNDPQEDRTRIYTIMLLVLIGAMIIAGWLFVYFQQQTLERAVTAAYQEVEKELVRTVGRSAQVYAEEQLANGRPVEELPQVEVEIAEKLVAPIQLLPDASTLYTNDAWIIGEGNNMVFDESVDFPYEGKPIDEFIKLAQVDFGASEYDQMVEDVLARREGVGQYIWSSEKGVEIGAWSPVTVTANTQWMIGVTTRLDDIMAETGANEAIFRSQVLMGIVTAVALVAMAAFILGQRRVETLKQQVVDLQIKIDQVEKARQVDAIVDTDYFKDLRDQAKSLRQQSRQRRSRPGSINADPPL